MGRCLRGKECSTGHMAIEGTAGYGYNRIALIGSSIAGVHIRAAGNVTAVCTACDIQYSVTNGTGEITGKVRTCSNCGVHGRATADVDGGSTRCIDCTTTYTGTTHNHIGKRHTGLTGDSDIRVAVNVCSEVTGPVIVSANHLLLKLGTGSRVSAQVNGNIGAAVDSIGCITVLRIHL